MSDHTQAETLAEHLKPLDVLNGTLYLCMQQEKPTGRVIEIALNEVEENSAAFNALRTYAMTNLQQVPRHNPQHDFWELHPDLPTRKIEGGGSSDRLERSPQISLA